MAEKKKAKKSSAKRSESHKKKLNLKNINYWAISTFVLAAILVIALIGSSVSGAAISSKVAGQKVIDFAAKQGAEAKLVSVEDQGSLYEVTLSIQGKEVPVYVTKDGKSLIPQVVPFEQTQNQQTQNQNQQTAPATKVSTKLDKPVVEAFVMAYCPYGTQLEKGLLPVIGLLGDKINSQIKFVYYSMHTSQGEVQEQLKQYCIEKEQNDKYLPYLTCFLEAGDDKGCLASTGIDMNKLETCTTETDAKYNVTANLEDKSKWLNGRYPLFNIYLQDNQKYKVGGSPTLVINGETVSTGRDSASLLAAICSGFAQPPEECNTVFNSTTPGPGFGWSTTGAANTAAYCG